MNAATLSHVQKAPLGVCALLLLLYFFGGKLSIWLTVMPEGMAILWIPNAAVLAALLVHQGRHYLLIAFTAFVAEIAVSLPTFSIVEALLFGATNVGEATLAFLLLRRVKFDPGFGRLVDAVKFVACGPLVSALLAALSGGAIYSVFRGGEAGYLEFVRIWWFGDGLGLIIFTPLFLAFWPNASRAWSAPRTFRPADAVTALLAVLSLLLLLLSDDGYFFSVHVGPIVLLPFVIYVAARFDMRWATSAAALTALLVAGLLTNGYDLFGALDPRDAVIKAQEFIFIMSLMALGLFAVLSQLRDRDRELGAANRRLNQMNRDLEETVLERTSKLRALNTQLSHLALTDPLTGLFNRRAFFDRARREVDIARRHERPLALMILDIDHFKEINDRHGHQAGDVVLQKVAETLGSRLRAADTLARFGGEEFVLISPDTDLDGAVQAANRMAGALREQIVPVEGIDVRVTASFGVTTVDAHNEDLEGAVKRADEALYSAKSSGRDRIVVLAPKPHV
ncbi:MAG: diguanylate cyclase [Burkholderiales bacterium]